MLYVLDSDLGSPTIGVLKLSRQSYGKDAA